MREIGLANEMKFKKDYAYSVIRLDSKENRIYFFDSKGILRVRILNTNFKDSFKDGDLIYQWVQLGVTNYELALKYLEHGEEHFISGFSAYNKPTQVYRGIMCYGSESHIKYRFRTNKYSLSSIIRNNLHMGSQERVIAGRCKFNNLVDLKEGLSFNEYLLMVIKEINRYVAENITPRELYGVTCPYLITSVGKLIEEPDILQGTVSDVVVVKIPKTCSNEEILKYKDDIIDIVLASVVNEFSVYKESLSVSNIYRSSESELRVVIQGF